jgi:methylated-DNA-[protein]-cysteine S-methyltransferase
MQRRMAREHDWMAMERGAPADRPIIFDSPIGGLGVVATKVGLRRVLLPNMARRAPRSIGGARHPANGGGIAVSAIEQITQYLCGERKDFDLPFDFADIGRNMRAVLDELCACAPYGKVITYGELAHRSKCPGGARAVGQIMAANPLPLVIPCHRVVAAADLGGYGGGLALKRRLLRLEGALTEQLSLIGDS